MSRQMLDKAKPDAVYIMLPPFAHGAAEELVIERRMPFFVEKPVAIDLATAQTVAAGRGKTRAAHRCGLYESLSKIGAARAGLLQDQKPVIMHGGWLGGGLRTTIPSGIGGRARKSREGSS